MAKNVAKQFKYNALVYSQRTGSGSPSFVLFHAPAAEVLDWAAVDRLEPDNITGAQRPLKKLKVSKVVRFFDSDKRNTVPTAIVVSLDEKNVTFQGEPDDRGSGSHGTLTISATEGRIPGLIIDGQHRVFGAAQHAADVHLNVVAFLGGDDAERAFQFVVINNSASRVSKDHIAALSLSYDKEDLNRRLISSAGTTLGLKDSKFDDFQLIDSSEPFAGLLAFPTNEKGFIAPNAIEAALGETRDRTTLLGIEELEPEFFLAIWSRIKHLKKKVWRESKPNDRSHLLEKVSIVALTIYILDSLVAAQRMNDSPLDFTDDDILHEYLDRVVTRIPDDFWTADWKAKELDTSAGRQLLLDALNLIDSNVRFGRQWWEHVGLIDLAELKDRSPAKVANKSKKTKKAKKKKA
ncbi:MULTISPECIES: DGQHR domain-containing protein [unclassified Bradyrhizobium]|uniref:DGQHR domain-containing protein n=1 Tax=unclassified Bradyrhizobium TaxID=2631580 RepID=UPI003398BE4E